MERRAESGMLGAARDEPGRGAAVGRTGDVPHTFQFPSTWHMRTRGRSAALVLTRLILTLMISRLIYPVGRNGGLAADAMQVMAP